VLRSKGDGRRRADQIPEPINFRSRQGAETNRTGDSTGEVARQFAEPPIDSYSVSVFQARIDGNTESLDGATVSREFALAVNDLPVTVIGVAEPGFSAPQGAQVWLPRIEQ
jgi:hypothetical protein